MGTVNQPELSSRSSITPQENHVVLLEHRIVCEDDFTDAAQAVFALVKAAQNRYPGNPRNLVITIEGHTGDRAGFDADFFEFQQEFMLGAMGRFFTWIELPLTGKLTNSAPQDDDLGDALQIGPGS
jgi:hypothetical protein